MANNESTVYAFFKDVSAKGIAAAIREHGTPDCSWWICGMGDVTGQLEQLSAAFQTIFDERGMVIIPQRMIAADDLVAVEAVTDAALRDGTEYKNTISYWITFSGKKISALREYFDGAYGQAVIGSKLADALGGAH